MFDLSPATADLLKLFVAIAGTGLGSLFGWRAISKTRSLNATDDDERLRLTDAFRASQMARDRAHQLANEMQAVQYRMGRLEAENEACNKRTDELALELKEVRAENTRLSDQVERLIRRNAETDIGKGL